MARWKTCYVCGGYSRGVRHRACKPAYKRRRFLACEVCGRPSRGVMHRACRYPDAGRRICDYCKAPCAFDPASPKTRHFHKPCWPTGHREGGSFELAMFRDLPTIIQRRCSTCGEWLPFASTEPTDERVWQEYWAPRASRFGAGFEGTCRACMAQRRREEEQRRARAA